MKVFIWLLFFSCSALAQPSLNGDRSVAFEPGHWSEGVHLLTGVGVNSAVFNSDTSHINFGLGLNFKADVGYLVSDRSDDFLIWDTLFTLGVRYRFHSLLFNTPGTFIRAFIGESPTVIYPGDPKNPIRAIGASRAQINGPLVGVGGGYFFKTNGGTNWFIEWDAAYQWLRFQDSVVDRNDVPIVLRSNEVGGNPKILTIALNLGLVLF
jgi:hypothetical protein